MIEQALERVWRRVISIISYGSIQTGDDSGKVQRQQVVISPIEMRDNTPRVAEYGFTSMPPPDSDAVVIYLSGDRTKGGIIATGHQASRLKNLASGEVALYDDKGQMVYLQKDKMHTVTPFDYLLDVTGNIRVNGGGTVEFDSVGGLRLNSSGGSSIDSTGGVFTLQAPVSVDLHTPIVNADLHMHAGGVITADEGFSVHGAAW